MTSRKRKPRRIAMPEEAGQQQTTDAEAGLKEAAWLGGADAKNGVYRDPEDPSRFFRRGRGGKSARVQKRVTVYIDEPLVREMDVHIARTGKTLNRSAVLQEALANYLEQASSQ